MLYFHISNYNQAAEGGMLATDPNFKLNGPCHLPIYLTATCLTLRLIVISEEVRNGM